MEVFGARRRRELEHKKPSSRGHETTANEIEVGSGITILTIRVCFSRPKRRPNVTIEEIRSRFSPDANITESIAEWFALDNKIFIKGDQILYASTYLDAASARRLARLLEIAAEIAEMEETHGTTDYLQ